MSIVYNDKSLVLKDSEMNEIHIPKSYTPAGNILVIVENKIPTSLIRLSKDQVKELIEHLQNL